MDSGPLHVAKILNKKGIFITSSVGKEKILNETRYKISIEAGSTDCWNKYIGEHGVSFGLNDFGKSAPYKDVYEHFGLTTDKIVKKIKKLIK